MCIVMAIYLIFFSFFTGGVVVIFILGWLTVCIGQYPLTTAAPPETATYRTTDILELYALMRAFYIFIFILFDLLYRLVRFEIKSLNHYLEQFRIILFVDCTAI